MKRKIRVVVADDHPTFLAGIVHALRQSGQIEVVGEGVNGEDALTLIREHVPDVAVIDFRMPILNGAQVASEVCTSGLPTRVLLLSAHDESSMVHYALQEGASGFLMKDSTRDEIVQSILDCAEGREVLSASLAAGVAQEIRRLAETKPINLSAREWEVLTLIADGKTVRAIADELHLAPSTVKTHVQHLYEKLDVNERAAAVAESMRRGWLQ